MRAPRALTRLMREGNEIQVQTVPEGILNLQALFEQPSDRTMGQFVCRGETEFFLDVGLMSFDSFDTQVQMFGHFAHRHALAYQVENL